MNYQQVGVSGVKASRVALGVMRIGGKTGDEVAEIVQTALDCGVNFFDTADIYGAGRSSMALGQALRDVGVPREDVVLQTKFGIFMDHELKFTTRYDFSRAHLMEALDLELERLQTDYVDFALLHRPDPLVDLDELAATFAEMRASGKVRHFGVSNMGPWQIEMLQAALGPELRLEANQLQFSLMHTHAIQAELHVNMEDDASIMHDGGVIPHARLRNMTIQAWSPFQYGTFSGCFIGDPQFPKLNAKLDAVGAELGASATAVAAAWILRHPAKMQVVCGSMSPEHIRETCEGAEVADRMTRQQWWDLYFAPGNDLP